MKPTLADYLHSRRVTIDKALEAFLPMPPACPSALSEAMRYSVFAGGKRFRPILTIAAAEAVAAHPDVRASRGDQHLDRLLQIALPAGCAIEMIHTYSLIHDDLPAMDDDTMRRGRPTSHVVYGEAMAILAGDALHTEAFALLSREPRTTDADTLSRKLRVAGVVAHAAGVGGMVGGQVIDLKLTGTARDRAAGKAAAGEGGMDADALQEMHARKTGALIRAASVAGAVMAGATDSLELTVDKYATELGLAFQIVDDILDVEGDAASMGKTIGKDAAAGKLTYPALFGMDESRKRARECADRARALLAASHLTEGYLDDIVEWVVCRTS